MEADPLGHHLDPPQLPLTKSHEQEDTPPFEQWTICVQLPE